MAAPDPPLPGGTGLFGLLAGDGRPPLAAVALALLGAGVFAAFQAATGHLLPHDEAWLGMTAHELHAVNGGRVLHFMIHDRVAFGGALISVGVLYLFLIAGPLARREPWAWWTLTLSGVVGFGSFLTWLGHGYLDTWHGVATLLLAPLWLVGLWRTRELAAGGPGALREPGVRWPLRSAAGAGRALLLFTAGCVTLGGAIIMVVGMTSVFVPQDLVYMGLTAADFEAINPRLVPLIAHDRAGFGGAVCCTGVTMGLALWCARPGRALWQAVAVANAVGFGAAIGVHVPIGYLSFTHLAPAFVGVATFAAGWLLSWPAARGGRG